MKKRPLLIGVAGGSGSGKTFFAREVLKCLGTGKAAMLSMDQYFKSTPSEIDHRDINFDHPAHLDFELMIAHLKELRSGRTIVAPSYDFKTMSRNAASVNVEPKTIVIVEGLFVLSTPMVEQLDLTVFLDVDADQRLLGRILRDGRERNASIEELVDRYQRFVRPSYDVFVAPTKQNADVVVDFTYRRILLTTMLVALIQSYNDQGMDVESIRAELKAECHHLGFTPRDGSMPVSIDILKLARDYPESVSSKLSIR